MKQRYTTYLETYHVEQTEDVTFFVAVGVVRFNEEIPVAGSSITYSDLVGSTQKDFKTVGKVTTQSVFKHTGKHWEEWIRLLDKKGARSWTYQEIVAFLQKVHKLSPWWQQGVALGFEIATGRRRMGQDAKGNYMVTATKSLPVSAPKAWKFLMSKAGIRIWLNPLSPLSIRPQTSFETEGGYFGEVRTVSSNRRVRMYWQDPLWEKHTVVELLLVSRPKSKSILVFNHTGIKEVKTQALLRALWKQVVEQIFEALEGGITRRRFASAK